MDIFISVLHRTLIAGTPLLIGTIGEIITERSGVLNLGVEGMMAIGAASAFIVTYTTGNPLLGILVAVLAGIVLSTLHAFVSVTLGSNQVISGLALTMLGIGLSGLWAKPYIGRPLREKVSNIRIPVLADIPIVGDILFYQDPFLFAAIFLGVAAFILLYKTRWGIQIRSVGEYPQAAESQGVNIFRVRYLCVQIGGAMAGLAGAHLSISYSKSWMEGITAGRGWIVIALTIFALWNPLRAFWGSFLFGGIFVLQYLLQPLGIPPNLLGMLPYIATLAALLFEGFRKDKRRLHAPAVLGEVYTRGER